MASFKTILAKLTKQKKTSLHIGALLNAYSSTAIIYSPLTLMGVTTTVYGLWGAEVVRQWLPWFQVQHLLAMMVLFILVMMLFFYKVIIPSQFAFTVNQYYKHRNPMVTDLQTILKNQKAILRKQRNTDKRIDKTEKAVSELMKIITDGKGKES